MPVQAFTLHSDTPTLTVIEPRGLTVRSVSYCRSAIGEAADERINRTAYDGAGRAIAQWDARLATDASALGNLVAIHSLSGKSLGTTSVDAGWRVSLLGEADQPVQGWDGRGSQRRSEYDNQLRPSALFEQAVDGEPLCTERFGYGGADPAFAAHNQCGQLIRHDDPAGTQLFAEFGLTGGVLEKARHFLREPDFPNWPELVADRDKLLESVVGATTRSRFNPLGETLEQADAKGNRQLFSQTVAGQLREVRLQLKNDPAPKTLVSTIQHNAHGQTEREIAGNGVITTLEYAAEDSRLTRLQAQRGNDTLQDLRYAYDPVGNVLSIEDAALPIRFFANQRIEPINRYRYDSLYQLIESTGWEVGAANQGPSSSTTADPAAVGNYRQTYRYDAGNNLLELIHVGPQNPGHRLIAAAHSNRCLPVRNGVEPGEGDFRNGFDANGNLLQMQPGQTLSWDVRNQLREVRPVERDSEADDSEHYVYGADGMRARKVRSTQTNAQTVIAEVRYLPNLELRTHSGTGEVFQVINVQTGRGSVRVLHWEAGGPEEIANNQQRYSLMDHLGSSTLELDQDANVISQERYYPFGGTAWADGEAVQVSYKTVRYSGKERDATGLYYYGFRYYAAWLQRWLNPDPKRNIDGLNLYRMVRNSPVTFYDALGNESTRDYFDEKDVEGFSAVFSAITTGLKAQGISPDKTLYLMVGRSPQTLGAFIEQQGCSTALLQMSGLGADKKRLPVESEITEVERSNRRQFIQTAIGAKGSGREAIVLLDYALTGSSLVEAHKIVRDHYAAMGSDIKIKTAMVSRYTDDATLSPREAAVLRSEDNVLFDQTNQKGFLDLGGAGVLRYMKILHSEVDKGLSYTEKFLYTEIDAGTKPIVDPDKRFRLGVMMKSALSLYPDVSQRAAKNRRGERFKLQMIVSGRNRVDEYINRHNAKRESIFKSWC